MKKLFAVFLLLCLAWTACERKESKPTTGEAPSSTREKAEEAMRTAADKTKAGAAVVAEKTKDLAGEVKDAWNRKRVEWRLSDSDIKADLERTGRVVREKSAVAGEKIGVIIDNARVTAVINGKLIADPDLSAFKIDVDTDQGVVTLKGSVKSLELIGRVTALALETEGVRRVVSLLRVEP